MQNRYYNLLQFTWPKRSYACMLMSSNGNIFHITGPLRGESTGHRWIPLTKASDAELWCFLLICAWSNSWAKNRDASDLRCHRNHYEVAVMWIFVVEVLSFVLWVTGGQWPTKPDNPVTDPPTINSKITWGQSLGWEVFKIYTTPDLFMLLGPLGL